MASASLHLKTLKVQENSETRGRLDAFFAKKQHCSRPSDPATASHQAQMDPEGVVCVKSEAAAAQAPSISIVEQKRTSVSDGEELTLTILEDVQEPEAIRVQQILSVDKVCVNSEVAAAGTLSNAMSGPKATSFSHGEKLVLTISENVQPEVCVSKKERDIRVEQILSGDTVCMNSESIYISDPTGISLSDGEELAPAISENVQLENCVFKQKREAVIVQQILSFDNVSANPEAAATERQANSVAAPKGTFVSQGEELAPTLSETLQPGVCISKQKGEAIRVQQLSVDKICVNLGAGAAETPSIAFSDPKGTSVSHGEELTLTISENAQLGVCVSKQEPEATKVQHSFPAVKISIENAREKNSEGELGMKLFDYSAGNLAQRREILAEDPQLFTDPSDVCFNTSINNLAGLPVSTDETFGRVAREQNSATDCRKERVCVSREAEAPGMGSDGGDGNNFEKVDEIQNLPAAAMISGYLLRSRETSGKTNVSLKQKLKLDADSKMEVNKKSKRNGEQNLIDNAMKVDGVSELAKDNVPKASSSIVSNDFFMPASKKRVKLNAVRVEIKEATTFCNQKVSGSKKRRKVAENEALKVKVITTDFDDSKVLNEGDRKLMQGGSVELEAINVDDSVPAKVYIDLWKEAKLAAEENARMSAGKVTHPFFSRQQRSASASCQCSPSNAEVCSESLVPCELGETPPLISYHVTQADKQMNNTVDWRHWNLEDPSSISRHLDSEKLSRGRRYFDALQYSMLNGSGEGWLSNGPGENADASILQMNFEDFSFRDFFSKSNSNVHEERSTDGWLQELLEYLKFQRQSKNTEAMNHEEAHSVEAHDETEGFTIEKLKERLNLYYDCWSKPRSSGTNNAFPAFVRENNMVNGSYALWTDRYQPHSSIEVCGNKDSTLFLNNWLHSWKLKISSEGKTESTEKFSSTYTRTKLSNENDDTGRFQGDSSDEDTSIEEEELCNALLLTGPVGCGKSAAVYACAREQGFTVLEINASEVRNGALIKHKFGEAMESHGLSKWSMDEKSTSGCSPIKVGEKRLLSLKEEKAAQADKNPGKCDSRRLKQHERHTLKKSPLNQVAEILRSPSKQERPAEDDCLKLPENQRGRITLILFEDVDLIFEEDRGFMSALVQLARTTKRPLILTSNKGQPYLPQLEKLAIQFTKPSMVDMVVHIFMICMSENMPKRPVSIEQLVKICCHDLRKLMMMLQFWGQTYTTPKQLEVGTLASEESIETPDQLVRIEVPCRCLDHHPSNSSQCCACISSTVSQNGKQSESLWEQEEIANTCGKVQAGMARNGKSLSSDPDSVGEVLTCEVLHYQLENIWASGARHLLASDAMFSLLPHLLFLSFPCPLSESINEKVVQAVRELEELFEKFAADSAERMVALIHSENQKSKKLRNKLKTMLNCSPIQEEQTVTANLETSVENWANDEAFGMPADAGIICRSPINSAKKARLSRRHKLQQSIVFSDSEDDSSVADIPVAGCKENSRHSVLNTFGFEKLPVDGISRLEQSCSNFREGDDSCRHDRIMMLNDKLTYDKPDAFRRLRRLDSGHLSWVDGHVKGEKFNEQTVFPVSEMENLSRSSATVDLQIVKEEMGEAQNLEAKCSSGIKFVKESVAPSTVEDHIVKNDISHGIAFDSNHLCSSEVCIPMKHLSVDRRDLKLVPHSCDMPSIVEEGELPNGGVQSVASRFPVTDHAEFISPHSTEERLISDSLNPVIKIWSSLLESKAGLSVSDNSFEALKISCSMATFEDVLSASDILSSIHEPQRKDSNFGDEVAVSLAQTALGICLQQCQYLASSAPLLSTDLKTPSPAELGSDVGSVHEHELIRQERKAQLQEILDSVLLMRTRAADEGALADFASYVARISQLEELRRSTTPSRSCRVRKQLNLDTKVFSVIRGKGSALYQLPNFEA